MSRFFKLGIAAALAGLVIFSHTAVDTVNEWVKKASVSVAAFGVPQVKGSLLTLPVNLSIQNPLPVTAPIDNLRITLQIMRGMLWQALGQTDSGPFQITPGTSSLTIYPQIDMKMLIPGFSLSTLLALSSGNVAQIKVIKTLTVQGFDAQSEEVKQISISDILSHV